MHEQANSDKLNNNRLLNDPLRKKRKIEECDTNFATSLEELINMTDMTF